MKIDSIHDSDKQDRVYLVITIKLYDPGIAYYHGNVNWMSRKEDLSKQQPSLRE